MAKFNSKTGAAAGKKSSRKNVPNKTPNEIREAYQLLIENNLTKMKTWLNKVAKDDPAKALEIMLKFSDFLIPKLSRTEIEDVTSVEEILRMNPQDRAKRLLELRSQINSKNRESWTSKKK